MLVLTRKSNQSIIIGNDIEVTIVEVRGEQVRLGITAPKEIPIYRREIYEAISRGKQEGQKETDAAATNAEPAFVSIDE